MPRMPASPQTRLHVPIGVAKNVAFNIILIYVQPSAPQDRAAEPYNSGQVRYGCQEALQQALRQGCDMSLPADYLERVYAGVLGKLIGVYVGRPFEGWTYERILRELGSIDYYVNDKLNVPLVVTDDDVSGTFTFVRALAEHGARSDLSPEAIGKTWLNSIIEKRSILWWGGNGISTEHTAWLNLAKGIAAPQSGSIERNGKTIAEQIGAQIFID